MADNLSDLAVYVHWPYCTRICPYCDFNVYKSRRDDGLVSAIIEDLSYWRTWGGPRRVTSLHFGGGTPSLMKPDDIAQITNAVRSLWTCAPDMEVAIEANPGDADHAHWLAAAAVGVTRMSLGVQTFHDPALKMLGRDHNAEQARAALEMATSVFAHVSLDLIFGWHGQTQQLWAQDLDVAVNSGAGHVSAYQLTIEPGTAFAKAEDRGDIKAVDADASAALYAQTRAALLAADFQHYEVSNYARDGQRSRHNLAYWQGQDYAGVGPGAHGRLTVDGRRHASVAEMRPAQYQSLIAKQGHGIAELETLTNEAWAEEYLMMGLRISEGISLTRFESIAGQALAPSRITPLVDDEYLSLQGGRLSTTDTGRPVLNYLIERLLV